MGEQMFTMKSEVVLTRKSVKDGASQFQNFRVNFHKFHAVLYEIIIVRLGYRKLWARWISKMLTGADKTQRIALKVTCHLCTDSQIVDAEDDSQM
jgi:hypothetical protein